MTGDSDRIAVPTNGRSPHPVAEPHAPFRGEPPTGAPPTGATAVEPSTGPSARQLAVGFGILASLILLIAGRARRRPGR